MARSRNIKIIYFTDKVFHNVDLKVPKVENVCEIDEFFKSIKHIAADAIRDFDKEGGCYEKKKTLRSC